MKENFFEFLCELSRAKKLPSHDYLFELADKCSWLLENEIASYRPESENHEIGGLLDFTDLGCNHLPLIIVPDLHARTYFLRHILEYRLPTDFLQFDEKVGSRTCADSNDCTSPAGFLASSGKGISVFEALCQKKIRLLSVGDLLHSELRGRTRWLEALLDFKNGVFSGKAMTEEMQEGLSLLSMVMELKNAFPENFHVLKGNHENIMNSRDEGNFPFRKFADEGEMVYRFVSEYYGDDILMVISCFEKALPLVAAFPECVVSHAEPACPFLRSQIVNGMHDSDLIQGVTWTPNDEALEGSCAQIIYELTGNPEGIYFGGHRPIMGTCTFRQSGKFIQIHNPEREFITLIHKNRIFNPDTDIVDVGRI